MAFKFYTPAWMEDNSIKIHRALKAVEKMRDAKKLERVAREAPRHETRRAAIDKISDPTVVSDLAKNADAWATRKTAVEKITDQVVLSDIAVNDENKSVRLSAIERLNVQEVLADIIKDDTDEENEELRFAALKNITDQSVLTDRARNDINWRIRFKAAKRLNSDTVAQEVYAALIKEDIGNSTQMKIVQRLTDQTALTHVVKQPNPLLSKKIKALRESALEKITDQSMLDDIAQNADDEDLRTAAAEKIKTLV